jgi:hypothetical protein
MKNLTILFALSILAACGGGGDSNPYECATLTGSKPCAGQSTPNGTVTTTPAQMPEPTVVMAPHK